MAGGSIELAGLSKHFGDSAAVDNVLRLGTGASLQALLQNDGERLDLAQGTPVHAYLPADTLRVLAGAPSPGGGERRRGPAGELRLAAPARAAPLLPARCSAAPTSTATLPALFPTSNAFLKIMGQ